MAHKITNSSMTHDCRLFKFLKNLRFQLSNAKRIKILAYPIRFLDGSEILHILENNTPDTEIILT